MENVTRSEIQDDARWMTTASDENSARRKGWYECMSKCYSGSTSNMLLIYLIASSPSMCCYYQHHIPTKHSQKRTLNAINHHRRRRPHRSRTTLISARSPRILILLPLRQHIPNPRRIRQSINLLKILPTQLKRLRRNIRNILPHQLSGINTSLINLFHQKGAERLHPAP